MKNKKIATIAVSAVLAAAIPTSAAAVGKWVELGKAEENTIKIGTFVGAREMELEETPARITFKFQKSDKIADFRIVRQGDPDVTIMGSVSEATLSGDEYSFTISKNAPEYVAGATYSLEISPASGIHITGGGTSFDVTATEPTGTTALTVDNDDVVCGGGDSIDITAQAFWNEEIVTDPVVYSFAVKEGAPTGIVTIGQPQNGKVTVTASDYGATVLTVTANIYGDIRTKEVTVNVVDTHTVFVSENESITAGTEADTFEVELSTLSTQSKNSVALGDIKISDKEGNESQDTLSWSVKSGSDKVKTEGGKVIAIAAGEAVLSATYHNREVELYVTATRPEVEMTGTFSLERLDGTGSGTAVVEGVKGTLESAALGTGANIGVALSGETLTYNREGLPTAHTALGKNLNFTITTNEAVFKYKVSAYTQIINDYDELKNFGTTAKAQYTDGINSGGYFILGNNIECADETYVSTLPNEAQMSGETSYNPYKFHGIFDGDGYNINNFSPDQNGLIPCMGTRGQSKDTVIRNVSFTNATQLAKSGWNTAIIAGCGNGMLENVYIHVKKFVCVYNSENNASLAKNAVIMNGSDWEVTMNNVIVEIDELVTGTGDFGLISRGNTFNNVYSVGAKGNRAAWDSTAKFVKGKYGSFDSREELKAADVSAAFTDPFWTVVDGVPHPTKLVGEFDRTDKQNFVEVSEQIKTDTALHIDVSDVIKGEATITKVTVGTALDPITTDAGSGLKNLKALKEITYTTGITVTDGVVSVANGLNLQMYGEHNFTIEYTEGGKARKVSGSILLATQVINDFDELTNFGTVAKSAGSEGNARGYFMLGNSIYCGGRSYVSKLPNNPTYNGESWNSYRFHGTFDGNGYNIDGFSPDSNGLIPCMGIDCYIKNVSFSNAVKTSGGGLVAGMGAGLFENVYVHVKSFNAAATGGNGVLASGGSWETIIRNTFVEIDEIKNSPATFGIINATAGGRAVYHLYALGLGSYNVRSASAQANKANGNTYDKFDSAAAMKEANIAGKSGAFHSPFWVFKDGIPRPANLPSFTESTKSNVADVYESKTEGFTLDVSDRITDNDATVDKVIVATQTFISGISISDGVITVSGALDMQLYGDDMTFFVEYTSGGEKRVVSGKMTLYTQIINDFDELKNFGTVAKSLGSATDARGYFVLGNDIDCNGEKFTGTFPNNPNTAAGYNPYQTHVIFDGKGHNIDNFNPDANGLISCMGTDAYIKNVSFTNAIITGGSTILAVGQGNVENIYVHVKTYTRSGGNDVVLLRGGDWNTPVKNVIVVVDSVTGTTNAGQLNAFNAVASLKNVYAVGLGSGFAVTKGGGSSSDVSAAYDTLEQLKAANVTSAFTDPFWTANDGIPYPSNLVNKQ